MLSQRFLIVTSLLKIESSYESNQLASIAGNVAGLPVRFRIIKHQRVSVTSGQTAVIQGFSDTCLKQIASGKSFLTDYRNHPLLYLPSRPYPIDIELWVFQW